MPYPSPDPVQRRISRLVEQRRVQLKFFEFTLGRLNSVNSSFRARETLPDSKRAFPTVLSHSKLSIKERNTDEEEHKEVRNEKHSPSILVCKVGESPDISKANAITDTGEDELDMISPGLALAGISNLND